VLLRAPGNHELIETPVPPPGPGEVLVRVAATGICGSDVELFAGRRPEPYVRYPLVPGHEWAGTVAAVGDGVRGLDPGVPVVAEGFRSCGVCARCRENETTLCTADYAETGFTHPGAFSEYVTVPARLVHVLPPGTALDEAALLEPAACVAAGVLAAAPRAAASVAVFGTGALGLLAVQMFALYRPARLVLVGRRPDLLGLGAELGATETVRAEHAGELAGSADIVFEATGSGPAVPVALATARRGGTVVLEGIAGGPEVPVQPDLFALHKLRVLGVFGANPPAWQHAVDLYTAGALTLGPLISHRLPLAEYGRALKLLADRPPQVRKVLLVP
jgi:threonine dehydrogenase-like Zn-dependent dehydrogenase